MARKKDGVNKSEAIRTEESQNPELTAKQVVANLGKKGVTVTEALVYNVRATDKEKAKKAARANGRKGRPPASASAVNPVHLVVKVKSFAGEVGGIKNLKQLVDAMAE